MTNISRRQFLKNSTLSAAALSIGGLGSAWPSPLVRSNRALTFRPFPHPWMDELRFVYAADDHGDPFESSISVKPEGIVVPADFGDRRFSVNAMWFVDGFGKVYLSADNGGHRYQLSDFSQAMPLNLNYEFARSRIERNRQVRSRYEKSGTSFSSEVRHLTALAEELFESASKSESDYAKSAALADRTLKYALWSGEKMELEHARQEIARQQRRDTFYFGSESRQYIWAKSEDFTKRFSEVFNFATITHYIWDTWYPLFEPKEGKYNWGIKNEIADWLLRHNITIQGRPLFWFHPIVTPDWLKNKNFDELKKYVEKHTYDLVSHYGDKVRQWSVVNEYNDWANIHRHTPEQITEITRLACDKTREVGPEVVRIINHNSPWGEYVTWGRFSRMQEPAGRPMRTPRKFVQDLLDAGVDFEVIGLQIYFRNRDLSDIARKIEQFSEFGKPIYITEMSATSGPSADTVLSGQRGIPDGPYDWHRHWDEELQADWLEQVYTLYYSRPYIKAISWYDCSDFRPFIVNGGLIREDSSPKRSFFRLKELLRSWNRLPKQS